MFKQLLRPVVLMLVFLLLSLFLTQFYLEAGFPYTHDGENHLARFANYKVAIKEGQFPPRWAPNLMNRYGYPVFNYNYPLANIISLPFSFLKISYETTFKLIIIGAVAFGCGGVYLITSLLTDKRAPRFVAVFTWLLSPFLLTSILFRGNIGEVIAYSLFPWLGWVVLKIWKNQGQSPSYEVLAGIGLYTALLLAHNIAAVFGTAVLLVFSAPLLRKRNQWLRLLIIAVASACLSLWFWLPALLEIHLVTLDSSGLSNMATLHAVTLSQLLSPAVTFGYSYPGPIDSLSFGFGTLQWMILLLASGYWIVSKKKLQLWGVAIALTWCLLLAQLEFFSPLWELLPFIRFIQFPWRLTLLTSLSIPIISVWLFLYAGKYIKVLLLVLVILQGLQLSQVKPVDRFHRENIDYEAFTQSTTTSNENLPKNFTYLQIGDWQPTARILSGAGEISIESWQGSKREYDVTVTEDSTVVEPTAAFAGWSTTITPSEDSSRRVEYVDNEEVSGRIAYQLQPGRYTVHTAFTQNTWPRLLGNAISILTMVVLAGYYGYRLGKR
ncbi:MAG: 6-pyruvoyl-tetrahydropterin synthase-related protein [bacterium]|nr:6-pyruvoyl-tetrahydropterin synthase-related protein [bacterium]